MTILVALIIIVLMALISVSVLNRIQQRQRLRRLQQRRLRLQIEGLKEIMNCLEHTLATTTIAKLINDKVIELLQDIKSLEANKTDHIDAAIQQARSHAEQLMNPKTRLRFSYQRDSDAQIAKSQMHINEAIELLPHFAGQGKLSESELDVHLGDLRWAHLMIAVMSYIGQGDKCTAISDRFSAQAFYRKAQQLLIESLHPDPRRMRLIKELGELIEGSRSTLSHDLH